MTGKKLDDRIGKIHFGLMFIGFHTTFLVQHWIGDEGMVRRIPIYPGLPANVTTLNQVSSIGKLEENARRAAVLAPQKVSGHLEADGGRMFVLAPYQPTASRASLRGSVARIIFRGGMLISPSMVNRGGSSRFRSRFQPR